MIRNEFYSLEEAGVILNTKLSNFEVQSNGTNEIQYVECINNSNLGF